MTYSLFLSGRFLLPSVEKYGCKFYHVFSHQSLGINPPHREDCLTLLLDFNLHLACLYIYKGCPLENLSKCFSQEFLLILNLVRDLQFILIFFFFFWYNQYLVDIVSETLAWRCVSYIAFAFLICCCAESIRFLAVTNMVCDRCLINMLGQRPGRTQKMEEISWFHLWL